MLVARAALQQPLPLAAAAAAAASRALGGMRPFGGSPANSRQAEGEQQEQPRGALEWLERFTNWERRGVPPAAGTDSDSGFDLVRGWAWQTRLWSEPAWLLSCLQLAAVACCSLRCLVTPRPAHRHRPQAGPHAAAAV